MYKSKHSESSFMLTWIYFFILEDILKESMKDCTQVIFGHKFKKTEYILKGGDLTKQNSAHPSGPKQEKK